MYKLSEMSVMQSSIKASIVIPVLNGGTLLKKVLASVLEQAVPWPYELLVIDSGSDDGSAEYCEGLEDVQIVRIPPSEFGHGKTRNYGASLTSGEFIVFLTQDALPVNDSWLYELVNSVDKHPKIAGAFGRHVAYDRASIFTKRDLQKHFDGFLEWPEVVSILDAERYKVDEGYRSVLRFFSDNSSCIRRSVWKVVPYPDIDFGEDQVWAKTVVELGYGKAFANNSIVYHSHDYELFEQFKRSFDEGRFFYREFAVRPWGNLGKCLFTAIRSSVIDIRYLNGSDINSSKAYWRVRQPLLNLFKMLGLFVGGYEKYLPGSALHRLSRDKSLNKLSCNEKYTVRSKVKIKYIIKKLFGRKARKALTPAVLRKKNDVVKFYSFLDSVPFGLPFDELEKIDNLESTINWVIPSFGEGSGGHLNIFRTIYYLEKQGFICRIYIVGNTIYSDGDEARRDIRKFFFPIEASVEIGEYGIAPAWYTFATSWITAYTVRNFNSTKEKLYFVQDFEPYFYPRGAEYAFAEETYRFGFRGVTAGKWLADKLSTDYGMETHAFSFSYDKDLYSPGPGANNGTRHIFFYARPPTARRAFELGLKVLDKVVREVPDTAVVFAGWDISTYAIDYPHLNAGIVKLDKLSELYANCEVSLVLSFTNASLLPLELMGSGCPVVSNKGANTEWLLSSKCAALCAPTVDELADTLISLLKDDVRLKQLRENGLAYAKNTDWSREVKKIGAYLGGL